MLIKSVEVTSDDAPGPSIFHSVIVREHSKSKNERSSHVHYNGHNRKKAHDESRGRRFGFARRILLAYGCQVYRFLILDYFFALTMDVVTFSRGHILSWSQVSLFLASDRYVLALTGKIECRQEMTIRRTDLVR
jgi:hypothetical protein